MFHPETAMNTGVYVCLDSQLCVFMPDLANGCFKQ